MNTTLAVIVGIIILVLMAKYFRKAFWGLVFLLIVEVIAIIIWPQILVGLADLAIKVRELFVH